MFLGHFTSLKMSPQGENVTTGIFTQNPHALPNWPNVHCNPAAIVGSDYPCTDLRGWVHG